MRLTTFVIFAVCYTYCLVLFTGSAQGAIASVAETARNFENNFLKIAGARGASGARGRPGQRGRSKSPAPAIDLTFIIDRSGSVGRKNFDLSLRFIEEVLNFFSVSPSTARVAAISYATTVKTEFLFNAHVNRECVIKAVKNIRYTRGLTATAPSLQRAQTVYSSTTSGARVSAKKVVFFLTDGKSNRNGATTPKIAAKQLKDNGAQIYVMGIGTSVRLSELRDIASSNGDVFRVRNFADLQQVINHLNTANRVKCSGSGTRTDECGRRCSCVGGKLVNCCRVRKDFASMSTVEKERYISALRIVSTQQPYKARYDALIKIHDDNFNNGIHNRDQFLPWHRWYLLQFENILREVDCRVTISYWDWSLWSHDPWSANAIWSAIGNRGFGGNGNPSRGQCVTTGPFRTPGWSIPTGTCLRRSFSGNVPDAVQVQFNLNMVPFNNFEIFLRLNLHDTVHVLIGGTMLEGFSPSAPEFHCHHGFVDKIWADWQKKSSTNLNAHFPGVNGKMTATNYYARDLIDLNRQPGCVRVCYDDPTVNNGRRVKSFLRRLTPSQLGRITRKPFSSRPSLANRIFRVSKSEQIRARQLEVQALRGVTSGRRAKTKSSSRLERILGFKLITPPRRPIRPFRPPGPPVRPRPPPVRPGLPPAAKGRRPQLQQDSDSREDFEDDELIPEPSKDDGEVEEEDFKENVITADGDDDEVKGDESEDFQQQGEKSDADEDEEKDEESVEENDSTDKEDEMVDSELRNEDENEDVYVEDMQEEENK